MVGRARRARWIPVVALGTVLLVLGACSAEPEEEPRIVQGGAPGEGSRVLDPDEVPEVFVPEHTDTDVRFMQMMILHHEQAVRMTGLVPDRTAREDVPLFAERIELSQVDEIAFMQRWLEERGEEPVGVAHDHGDGGPMPGMLTDEQMARLEAASGEEFDRLFLDSMYYHHLGALQMVEELLSTDGSGAEPELWRFANHIDSDQRIELGRIEAMLAEMEAAGG